MRLPRWFVAAITLSTCAALTSSAQPDDPFKPVQKKDVPKADPPKKVDPDDPFAPGAKSAVTPEPGAKGATAPAWTGDSIPVERNAGVTFGPAGCYTVVVGQTVWDAKTNKPGATLDGAYEQRGLRALSADGKLFAAAAKSPNQTDTAVTVWNTETGKKALDVPGVKANYVDFLALARNKYLLLGGRHNNKIDVWDLDAKKVTKTLTVPDRRVEPDGKIAFTPDGKFFACVAHDKIVVTDTATNKIAATLAPPGPGVVDPSIEKQPSPNPKLNAIFVFSWMRGMAFSPDGTELAAFSTHPTPRLLVWSAKGKLILDEPVPMPMTVSHRNTLEWQPDGSGWLVNGYLYDRAAKRITLSIRVPFAADVLPHLLDKDKIIGVFGEDRNRLQTVALPSEKLAASLKAMASKADSFLAPGTPVRVDLELAGLRGDEAETRRTLGEALVGRLTRDGIRVAGAADVVLRMKLKEEAGDALPIFERQTAFDFRGRDTGKKATEAKGAAVLELWAKGEPKPLWRGHLSAMSGRSFQEEITDATVRKSMLEHLARQLGSMDMPYFIPKAKDMLALPAVVE